MLGRIPRIPVEIRSSLKLKEVVKMRINTTEYEFSHGKKPRGNGNWCIEINGAVYNMKGTITQIKSHINTFCKMSSIPLPGEIKILP